MTMTDRQKIQMDADAAATFAEAAATITTNALNGLSEAARPGIDARITRGAELYLHVQMLPEYIVVLALDPKPGDPASSPLEIARYTGATPDDIKRLIN
jgi:hypothetical protein